MDSIPTAEAATKPRLILFGAPEIPRAAKDNAAATLSGDPEQGLWLYCDDTRTNARFGLWEARASRFRIRMDGYTEFCHILEGEAEITDLSDGRRWTVRAGQSFVMEIGMEMEWHVPRYIRKCFAISSGGA